MNLNYLDIIIGIVIILFGVIGIRRGIIAEIASLLALWLGINCARHFSGVVAEWLNSSFGLEHSNGIAYALSFLLAFLFMVLIGKLASALAKNVGFGFIDKIGGFVLRLFEGLLVCGMLIMVMKTTGLDNLIKQEDRDKSVLYGVSETIIPKVSSWTTKTGSINFIQPRQNERTNDTVTNQDELLPIV